MNSEENAYTVTVRGKLFEGMEWADSVRMLIHLHLRLYWLMTDQQKLLAELFDRMEESGGTWCWIVNSSKPHERVKLLLTIEGLQVLPEDSELPALPALETWMNGVPKELHEFARRLMLATRQVPERPLTNKRKRAQVKSPTTVTLQRPAKPERHLKRTTLSRKKE